MKISVTISEEETRLLDSWMGKNQIQPWTEHAIENKLRQRVNASIRESTTWNPDKMSKEEKFEALTKVELPTFEERNAEIFPAKER